MSYLYTVGIMGIAICIMYMGTDRKDAKFIDNKQTHTHTLSLSLTHKHTQLYMVPIIADITVILLSSTATMPK